MDEKESVSEPPVEDKPIGDGDSEVKDLNKSAMENHVDGDSSSDVRKDAIDSGGTDRNGKIKHSSGLLFPFFVHCCFLSSIKTVQDTLAHLNLTYQLLPC